VAQQVEELTDKLTNSCTTFETFKTELSKTLMNIFDNQNIIKQELFLIRNGQAFFVFISTVNNHL
jgi:hypothetical protein